MPQKVLFFTLLFNSVFGPYIAQATLANHELCAGRIDWAYILMMVGLDEARFRQITEQAARAVYQPIAKRGPRFDASEVLKRSNLGESDKEQFLRRYLETINHLRRNSSLEKIHPVYNEIALVTHPQNDLQVHTNAFLEHYAHRKIPIFLLASDDFPITNARLMSQASYVNYSFEGEITNVAARKATVVGSFLNACVTITICNLILHSLNQKEISTIAIDIPGALVDMFYGTIWEFAQERDAPTVYDWLRRSMDILKSGLEGRSHEEDSFEAISLSVPKHPAKLGYEFSFIRERDGKMAIVRILGPSPELAAALRADFPTPTNRGLPGLGPPEQVLRSLEEANGMVTIE